MKKINALFLIITLFYIIALSILLNGCKVSRRSKTNTSDSVRIEKRYKDTTIYKPGDTVKIKTTVPCPDAKWKGAAKSGNTSLIASLDNGVLDIDCHQDSLIMRIKMLETEISKKSSTVTEVPVPVEVIRYRAPWWAKITLGFSLISLAGFAIKHRKLLMGGVSSIIKFFV